MEAFLPALAGLDSVLEAGIAAQIVPLALEADGRPPTLLGSPPVHAGHAAGVVFPHRFGPEHLHAGAVHVSQGGEAHAGALAAAAGGVAAAQAVGADDGFLSAVAAAQPGGARADVLRRGQDGKLAVALACQLQFFPGMP